MRPARLPTLGQSRSEAIKLGHLLCLPKADIPRRRLDVRLGPLTDSCAAANHVVLVGALGFTTPFGLERQRRGYRGAGVFNATRCFWERDRHGLA
jgi:hypothetical protein